VQHAVAGRAVLALAGFHEPRIEPELVFKLAGPLPAGNDPLELLAQVDWIAAGFEIVHSMFPGWRFRAPDCTVAFGLHGALVVGEPLAVTAANRTRLAAALPTFPVQLFRAGELIEQGSGANVLGSPLNALAHLRDTLAAQPDSPPLAAGEIVTTGTLTDAQPVAPGETWTSRYDQLGIAGLAFAFR
jgi:2-oxo-3-hexenedioate decarboxylase